jgi:hypothetical protein
MVYAQPTAAALSTRWRHLRAFTFGEDFFLEEPRACLSLLLALVATVLFCWPTWPGFMSFDSLFAYKESIEGVSTAIWPPMQAYLFFLSRQLGLGVAGIFFTQTFILFFSSALIFSSFFRGAWTVIVAFVTFCGLFVYFPTLWGTLGVLWKDVTTTSFALLGVAIWSFAIKRKALVWIACAALAFFFSLASRYNASH